jgi:hypothetical protein
MMHRWCLKGFRLILAFLRPLSSVTITSASCCVPVRPGARAYILSSPLLWLQARILTETDTVEFTSRSVFRLFGCLQSRCYTAVCNEKRLAMLVMDFGNVRASWSKSGR